MSAKMKPVEVQRTEPIGLYAKLVEVMKEVGRVEKKGFNDFHKYAYVTESDMVEAVRDRLSSRGVLLLPSLDTWKQDGTLTTVILSFTFRDSETGEECTAKWAGTGDDKGDKGLYKAYTGAEKTFLMKTFMVATGDDPEADTKTDQRAEARTESRPDTKSDVPPCPECGGGMWDNRTTKTGKQPDFKCKTKECGKAVWLNSTSGKGDTKNVKEGERVALLKIAKSVGEMLVATGYHSYDSLKEFAVANYGLPASKLELEPLRELVGKLNVKLDEAKVEEEEDLTGDF